MTQNTFALKIQRELFHPKSLGTFEKQAPWHKDAWLPFFCLGEPIWPPWRYVKTINLRQNKQTDKTNFTRKFKINGKHLVFYVINKDISSILAMSSLKWPTFYNDLSTLPSLICVNLSSGEAGLVRVNQGRPRQVLLYFKNSFYTI